LSGADSTAISFVMMPSTSSPDPIPADEILAKAFSCERDNVSHYRQNQTVLESRF
jgi:hypothetical protein